MVRIKYGANRSSFIIHRSALKLLCATLAIVVSPAQAQSYPVKPIRLIVPTVAGTGMDTVARTLGPKLTDNLGQPIVVDNRGGGSGTLAADAARYAAPNGYTLLVASVSLVIRPLLYKVIKDAGIRGEE